MSSTKSILIPESESGNALALLLGTEHPNTQGDTSFLDLAKELKMQAGCPECLEAALKSHIYLITQKYQKILALWKEAGCPDPGEWPDLYTDLFLVSYLRMESALARRSAEEESLK